MLNVWIQQWAGNRQAEEQGRTPSEDGTLDRRSIQLSYGVNVLGLRAFGLRLKF
jgi:hypothetical protein